MTGDAPFKEEEAATKEGDGDVEMQDGTSTVKEETQTEIKEEKEAP